jgi:soluble lytic murein transglycosylase
MAAARLIVISPARSADQAPVFVARLAYPTYYADRVVAEAERRGLDPLLMFALIRQESLFEGIAVSSAFANGLMQIIPSTGREIAAALDWPNYATRDLYRPYVSITFGTYYLARQRDYFDGDLYAALAAYNGGAGNTLRWHDAAGGDPDLFLESITLNETRTYLLRIREHLAMYQRLYGAPSSGE